MRDRDPLNQDDIARPAHRSSQALVIFPCEPFRIGSEAAWITFWRASQVAYGRRDRGGDGGPKSGRTP